MRLLRRFRYLLRRRREARELAEEIELHRAMAEDAQRAAGLSEEAARAAARRLMGNVTLAREDARRVWLAAWLESILQDLRYAVRSLASQPGFTAMALLALVLGIGLNTSLFTAINAVLSRPWNVPEPDRVVNAYTMNRQFGPGLAGFALTGVRFLNENSRTIEGALAFRTYEVDLDGAAGTRAAFVTGNFFNVLGVGMRTGRGFSTAEDVARSPVTVAVISHFLWTKRYGANLDIIGRAVRLDGVPFTVIGVAGESFAGTTENRTDVWAPFASLPLVRANNPALPGLLTDPGRCCSEVAARLRQGVSREQAQSELNALYRQYSAEVQRDPAEILLTGTAMLDHPQRRRRAAPVLALLLVAVGAILLLACANVSNLLLARAAARQREIAVRVALGAGRWRVVRQLLTESVLLAAIASAGGLLLACVLPDLILRFMGQAPPTNLHLTPDGNVLAYAVGIAALCALASGLAPALRGTRVSVSEAMKRQSAHASPRIPLRGTLLGVQVAVSVALLVAAGLLVRGLNRARSLDLGFQTEGVTAIQVTLPPNVYDPAREGAFFDDLVAKLDPTGESVGVSLLLPLGERREYTDFGGVQCASRTPVLTQRVSQGYFDVLRIPILAGRNFLPQDGGRGSILVNEALARVCWAGRSPVGERVNIGGRAREIVGVVRDAQV
jgi:predicted permease